MKTTGHGQSRFTSRFTTKLTATILLAALLPASLVGYLCIRTALESQKNTAREYYFATAERVQDRLIHRVEAASSLVLSATSLLANRRIDEASSVEAVRSLLAFSEEIPALAIYDVRGNAVEILAKQGKHSLPSKLPPSYLNKLASRGTASEYLIGAAPEILLDGSAPVLPICAVWKSANNANSTTSTIGYVVVALESEYLCSLAETLSSQMFSGARNRVSMTDSALRTLAHAERKRAFQRVSMRGREIFSTTMFQNDVSHYVGAVQEYISDSGEPMLGVALYLPLLRMVIVVEEPQTQAYRALETMRRTAIFWILGSAALASLGCILLARQFSQPIRQLLEAASQLSEQDFALKLPTNRSDEFGLVYWAMNDVAAELGKYQRLNIRQIIAERNKLETVVKQANDGILLLDGEKRVVIANGVFRAWFGIGGMAGETSIDALSGDSRSLHDVTLFLHEFSSSPDTVRHCEFIVQNPKELKDRIVRGSVLKIIAETSETQSASGAIETASALPMAYLLMLRDVTREVETDRLKTELVAVVAHELRSPLNSIYGLAELIGEGVLEAEETAEYGRTIAAQSRKLADIINKFLDLSRLESGKTEIHRVEVRLEAVLKAALTTNAPLAAKKSMLIQTRFPPDSVNVLGDPDLLGQVFVNLLSNAVKYSLPGKTITAEICNEPASVLVLITDEGYGISESSQQKLFTKFFRANDDRRVKDEAGTGLGLAFVKQIIEQHGGEVGVESRLGEGSRFWFRLPR